MFGNAISLCGNLANNAIVFDNADGSKKVKMTIFVPQGFIKNGKRDDQPINVEKFISKNSSTKLIPYLVKGAHLGVEAHLEASRYTNKAGEIVYDQKVIVDDIQLLGAKKATPAQGTAASAYAQTPVQPTIPQAVAQMAPQAAPTDPAYTQQPMTAPSPVVWQ